MRIFLDLDGVLVDLVGGLAAHHGVLVPYGSASGRYGASTYRLSEAFGMPSQVLWGSCDRRFWRDLDKTADADTIVSLAERAVGRDNVTLCTAPKTTPAAMAGRLDWCERHYPHLPVLFAIEAIAANNEKNGPPKHVLAHRDAMLIDDNQDNCRWFAEAGGHCFLWPAWWNDKHEQRGCALELLQQELEWVRDWQLDR